MLMYQENMKIRTDAHAPIIHWEFERNDRHLMCALRVTPAPSSYEVATVPLWDGGRTAVETFARPGEAFHRHAAIAADLRSAGWTVAAYTA
jgi:hypothetical protein